MAVQGYAESPGTIETNQAQAAQIRELATQMAWQMLQRGDMLPAMDPSSAFLGEMDPNVPGAGVPLAYDISGGAWTLPGLGGEEEEEIEMEAPDKTK